MAHLQIQPWHSDCRYTCRVFAVIYPHSDDFTFQSVGLIHKLIKEGYTGYFIRMTNDCMDSYDLSYGEAVQRIEAETQALAGLLGIRKVYDLNYNNHYLEHAQLAEIRHRLILLFRFLKVDTVITFDPYGHYEENPDHQITGMAVEQACWMAGRQLDLPETKDMGLPPHFVRERYFAARGDQNANCLIDITPALALREQAILLHKTPLDNMWKVYLETNGGQETPAMSYDAFVREFFIDAQQVLVSGLSHYEKYRHVIASVF